MIGFLFYAKKCRLDNVIGNCCPLISDGMLKEKKMCPLKSATLLHRMDDMIHHFQAI